MSTTVPVTKRACSEESHRRRLLRLGNPGPSEGDCLDRGGSGLRGGEGVVEGGCFDEPGARALTVIPDAASSFDSPRVKPKIAALDVAYAVAPACPPVRPAREAMLMMRPPLLISGRAKWVIRNMLSRLTAEPASRV